MKKIKIKVICIVLIFLSVNIMCKNILAFSSFENIIYSGIDVSEYQGYIDYSKVKESGIEVVYIRSSEGINFVDPYFRTNYDNAKANELKVGFYHYVTARNIEEAIEEADFFVSVIEGTSPDCKLAMDFEYFDGLNIYEINQIAIAFMDRVKEISKKDVVIYSDAYNANNVFNNSLSNYSLWVADYFVSEPALNDNWNHWTGFQYSDIGLINGINGNVDLDRFTSDIFLDNTEQVVTTGNNILANNDNYNITVIVKAGDTLSYLAYKYGTTIKNITALNNISNPNYIYIGQRIIIPTTTNAINNTNSKIYVVKAGDTLSQIAKTFNTTIQAIAIENKISNPNYIYIGETLIIDNVRYDKHDMRHCIYTVRPGDTLTEIAYKYNTTIQKIVNLNNIINPNYIYVGEALRI